MFVFKIQTQGHKSIERREFSLSIKPIKEIEKCTKVIPALGIVAKESFQISFNFLTNAILNNPITIKNCHESICISAGHSSLIESNAYLGT